jgi:hypothetical protein
MKSIKYSFCVAVTVSAIANGNVNHTGIDYAGTYPKGIVTCEPNMVPQQDCHNYSSLTYVKISAEGQRLPADESDWACVLDENTGLFWEAKTESSEAPNLHHVDDKFTWYNSNRKTNGGNIGQWNAEQNTCYGYQQGKPRTYCHVEQFASRTNKQGLCGFSDWRVPTRNELTSLIHFGQFQPSIDAAFFPNTLDTFYWTQNPVAKREIEAWSVDFEFGTTTPLRKTDLRPVRLVRGSSVTLNTNEYLRSQCDNPSVSPSAPNDRFEINQDGTVLDTLTQLIWQACVVGKSGDNCATGDVMEMNWQQALAQNTETWRLPSIRELDSLSELACALPAINTTVFPTSERATLWSSSPYRFYDHYAWYWDAVDGIYIYGDRSDKRAVRLVKNAN